MSQNTPKAELLSPGAVIFYFRFPTYFHSPLTGPCKINGSCCGSTYALSLPSAGLLTPVKTGLHVHIFLLPGDSLTPNCRLFLSAALCISALDSSIRWKKARRITSTQWWGHLPIWTDFHHFFHNPHFGLVLNFSDQVEKRSEGSCLRSPRAWSVFTSLLLWI